MYMIYAYPAYPAVSSQVEVTTRVCRGLFLTRPPAKTYMEKMREKAMQVPVKPVKLFAPFCTRQGVHLMIRSDINARKLHCRCSVLLSKVGPAAVRTMSSFRTNLEVMLLWLLQHCSSRKQKQKLKISPCGGKRTLSRTDLIQR